MSIQGKLLSAILLILCLLSGPFGTTARQICQQPFERTVTTEFKIISFSRELSSDSHDSRDHEMCIWNLVIDENEYCFNLRLFIQGNDDFSFITIKTDNGTVIYDSRNIRQSKREVRNSNAHNIGVLKTGDDVNICHMHKILVYYYYNNSEDFDGMGALLRYNAVRVSRYRDGEGSTSAIKVDMILYLPIIT